MMWSKWASNLVLLAVMAIIVLMVYWQHKLLSLEEQQKSIGKKNKCEPFFFLAQLFFPLHYQYVPKLCSINVYIMRL